MFSSTEMLVQGWPQICQEIMILMRSKDSGPQSGGLSTALSKKLVKVGSGDCDWFDFTQLATDRELRAAVPEWTHTAQSTFGPPMGRFGAAAILAALCSQLCLYGSNNSGGYFQYAARSNQEEGLGTETGWRSGRRRSSCCGGVHLLNRLDETFGTRTLRSSSCRYGLLTRTSGSRVHLLTAGLWCRKASVRMSMRGFASCTCSSSKEEWAHFRLLRPSQTRQYGSDRSQLAASRRIPSVSSSSSSSDSIAECVNRQAKTLHSELCAIRAQACISPHTRAPLSLHCLCDSGRAAAMSCCDGQPGPARTLSELPRQHSCITGGHRSRGKSTPNLYAVPRARPALGGW